ncbi:MAG: carbamoyltransferase HypF [Verrucomicrobia bacterium]|nr:carbamoyltransferase HypF [Verrucomicrobiota bacterium]
MSTTYEAVIGVWDGHDAGAALVIDGRVVLALNEERLTGRKLEVGFPTRSIAAMRAAAGNRRIAWAPCTSDPAKTLTRIFPSMKENYYQLRRRLKPPGFFHGTKQRAKYRLTQWRTSNLLRGWARRSFASALDVPLAEVFLVDHHEAHAASAAYWPSWNSDALIVTLDGIGDGESGSVWEWSDADSSLKKIISISGAASLGLFFEHVTNELQMRPLEDEGKVMALATYAANTPTSVNPFLKWFTLTPGPRGVPMLRCSVPPTRMASAVAAVVWCTPREQVARMAQQTLEMIVPQFFAMLAFSTGRGAFGYAGGVASNIKVNRLIRALPAVSRLEVCPAMGDGGLALGSALSTWKRVTGQRPQPFSDFRLGTDRGDLGREAEELATAVSADIFRPDDIALAVAELVAAGQVVMWAQGRMELGARALGARSIVARADSVAARDDLNLRLKRRVWFQPFCPSILETDAPALLEDYRGVRDANRHMTMGFMTTTTGRTVLAGAIGPDGSCRPQIVANTPGDPWCQLLTQVKTLTGTGAVINTSLNMHGKPMSDTAQGVVEAWVESGVQYLALGSALFSKKSFTANPWS